MKKKKKTQRSTVALKVHYHIHTYLMRKTKLLFSITIIIYSSSSFHVYFNPLVIALSSSSVRFGFSPFRCI